jgi:hypothetical protein
VLEPVDLTGHGTSLDVFGAPEASVVSEDPTLKPRGWWLTDPTRTRTDGLEESLAHLRDILRTQRFEVCPHPTSQQELREPHAADGFCFSVGLP